MSSTTRARSRRARSALPAVRDSSVGEARPRDRLSARAGCGEGTIRGSSANTATRSARLSEPCGKGIARLEQPQEPKQLSRAHSPHAWMWAKAQARPGRPGLASVSRNSRVAGGAFGRESRRASVGSRRACRRKQGRQVRPLRLGFTYAKPQSWASAVRSRRSIGPDRSGPSWAIPAAESLVPFTGAAEQSRRPPCGARGLQRRSPSCALIRLVAGACVDSLGLLRLTRLAGLVNVLWFTKPVSSESRR
jgi:hypothetical protein